MIYFDDEDIELIHIQIIDASGGSQGVRDRGRIQAALAAMQQEVFGQRLYETAFEKVAALARGIIADHPFVDGNKRTGVMAAIIFLNRNGIDTQQLTDQAFEDFAVRIAVEHLDVETIATWLETICKNVK